MEEWLDRNEYPFQSKYFDLSMGRMHYVDEGKSAHTIVMVHGNPAWSYTYRKLISCLSEEILRSRDCQPQVLSPAPNCSFLWKDLLI